MLNLTVLKLSKETPCPGNCRIIWQLLNVTKIQKSCERHIWKPPLPLFLSSLKLCSLATFRCASFFFLRKSVNRFGSRCSSACQSGPNPKRRVAWGDRVDAQRDAKWMSFRGWPDRPSASYAWACLGLAYPDQLGLLRTSPGSTKG